MPATSLTFNHTMAGHDPHHADTALEMLPEDDDDDELLVQDGAESPRNAPTHPVPSMQGPFEESIVESELLDANAAVPAAPKLSAKARHERLLSNKNYNTSYSAKWRAQPKAKWHPLSKTIAQIAFGVHLLHQQLAKSDEEVVKILQRHVDEVDNFIQNTDEDFDSALADIQERINYLKLPLEHVKIFDIMLDDRQFRNQIIDGNEKIEQIVQRTANLMNDLLTDVHKGVEATTDMALYLDKIADNWPGDESSLSIFNTMQANAEGWTDCFQSLQMKGNSLGVALVQLGSILNEMSKRAGVASRRSVVGRWSSLPLLWFQTAPPNLESMANVSFAGHTTIVIVRRRTPPTPINSSTNIPLHSAKANQATARRSRPRRASRRSHAPQTPAQSNTAPHPLRRALGKAARAPSDPTATAQRINTRRSRAARNHSDSKAPPKSQNHRANNLLPGYRSRRVSTT